MKKLNKEKLYSVLSERLEDNLKSNKTAGTDLLVMQSGKVLCHLVKGYKNYANNEILEPNSMFRLASMTKPITGIAVLIGVQNGWFGLNDRLGDYLPEFSDMAIGKLEKDGSYISDHKAKNDILVYQCLSHCNGILPETELGDAILNNAPRSAFDSIDSMLAFASKEPLGFEPGTYTAYTGYTSFDAMAKIIEMKSGMKYSEFLQKNLFDPLDIHDITFHPTEEQWSRMVSLHDRSVAQTLITVDMGREIFEGFGPDYECAGACLTSTIEDYAKIGELLLNHGTYRGIKILEPEMVEEMKKPRVPDGIPGREPNDSWGLGVRVKVHEDWLPEGTFGWSGAYGTHFWVDHKNEIMAIMLRGMRWYDTHGAGNMGIEFEKDVMSCLE